MKLKGKVALITGSSRGIGKDIAKGFAKEGADIIINGRNLERAKPVAKEIEGLGVKTMAIGADVSSSQDVNRMVEEAVNAFGRIDILVNNAGGGCPILPFFELPEDVWDLHVARNLKSVFLCSQAVGRGMAARGGGTMINIGSVIADSIVMRGLSEP